MAAVNSLGEGAESSLTGGTPVATYMPATPTDLTTAGFVDRAALTFLPTAGAVWFEAAVLPADGDWRVPTAALARLAPCSLSVTPAEAGCDAVQQIDDQGTTRLAFDVPLSALSYRDGQYVFKVRDLDAKGVPGDWSNASAAVTISAWAGWAGKGWGQAEESMRCRRMRCRLRGGRPWAGSMLAAPLPAKGMHLRLP